MNDRVVIISTWHKYHAKNKPYSILYSKSIMDINLMEAEARLLRSNNRLLTDARILKS